MPKDFKKYQMEHLDTVSPSFCAAKWYNATIWLNEGMTASCHHPPAHKVTATAEQLKDDPSLLHNTEIKKAARKEMLEGSRPAECQYCWKIEDADKNNVSDRVFKSIIYDQKDLEKIPTEFRDQKSVNPKTLEIAFDANCNFACSYCNAQFSTTWQRDIKKNGFYENLATDGAGPYITDSNYKNHYQNESNPYLQAFWDWFPELSRDLEELRITGGEATMSNEYWKLINWWKEHNAHSEMRFAVNSNLGMTDNLTDKFIDSTHNFKNFILYSSCESTGKQAEFVRDGLQWEQWTHNVKRILNEGNIKQFHIMMTINALSLFSLTDFMDYANNLKKEYGMDYGYMSVNILRFPSFMSITTLPKSIVEERAEHIKQWLNNNKEIMHEFEVKSIERLISYMETVEEPHQLSSDVIKRQQDFKSFYVQYCLRRQKNINVFPPELVEWFKSIV